MNKTRYDKFIAKTLHEVLVEQSENDSGDKKPKPETSRAASPKTGNKQGVISTTGAFGSGGRSRSFVAQAGARADQDPEGLMEDLGVTGPASGDDLTAALSVIRSAIYSNSSMSQAYLGAKIGPEREQKAIQITMSRLDRKNGVRFLAHTLRAAQNAGYLNLEGGLQFAMGESSDIAVFSI